LFVATDKEARGGNAVVAFAGIITDKTWQIEMSL
jgi:hypothetical protein